MKIKDLSSAEEKTSPFYLNHKEIIKIWEKQSLQLQAECSGEFNCYKIDIQIISEDPKLTIKGNTQQYTAQSSTLIPENSHKSESTLFTFRINRSFGNFKIVTQNPLRKIFFSLFASKEKQFEYNGFNFQSDSLASIRWAKESKSFKDITFQPSFVSLKADKEKQLITIKLKRIITIDRDFDQLYQFMNSILSDI